MNFSLNYVKFTRISKYEGFTVKLNPLGNLLIAKLQKESNLSKLIEFPRKPAKVNV